MNSKNKKKSENFVDFSNSNFKEDVDFLKLKDIVEKLKTKYKIPVSEIVNKLEKKEIIIPCEIFNKKLSGLETICKYLKENLNLRNKEISSLINRDERTIWQAYESSRKKLSLIFKIKYSEYYVPVSIFKDRRFSVLESIVKYLKENYDLSYHEIAVLLKRNDRTVWTVYQRALKKSSRKSTKRKSSTKKLRGKNVKK